jgi:AcrR family transcriptional regulator
MSKSGLYAHFGSKQELQLAAIDSATEIFTDNVIRPRARRYGAGPAGGALRELLSLPGAARIPGGCFFASATAELDTHPGPVKERLVESLDGWLALIERRVREAQEAASSMRPRIRPCSRSSSTRS